MKRLNEEVLVATEPVVTVGRADVETLKRGARANARRRIRLCAHRDVDDAVHEMLIVHERGAYVRPHKHLHKSESFHVIEGEADVVTFHDDGTIRDVTPMGEYSSGRKFYYRIGEPVYHTLLIRSPVVVFRETTSGPFRRADTAFAPWAPDESDTTMRQDYMARLVAAASLIGLPSRRQSTSPL